MKVKILIIDIITALFVLLFVYAALSKVMDFQKFKIELGKSPILNAFAGYVALLVPGIELVISALLINTRIQYYALYLSFSLMSLFTAYIVAILKFSSYIPCTCGGILQNMTWNQHLIFNIMFLILGATAVLLYPKKNERLIRDKKGSPHP